MDLNAGVEEKYQIPNFDLFQDNYFQKSNVRWKDLNPCNLNPSNHFTFLFELHLRKLRQCDSRIIKTS